MSNFDLDGIRDTQRAKAVLRKVVPVRFSKREPRPGQKHRDKDEDHCGCCHFRCIHCGQMTHERDGGADLLPYGCSECWCRAHDALVAKGVIDA